MWSNFSSLVNKTLRYFNSSTATARTRSGLVTFFTDTHTHEQDTFTHKHTLNPNTHYTAACWIFLAKPLIWGLDFSLGDGRCLLVDNKQHLGSVIHHLSMTEPRHEMGSLLLFFGFAYHWQNTEATWTLIGLFFHRASSLALKCSVLALCLTPSWSENEVLPVKVELMVPVFSAEVDMMNIFASVMLLWYWWQTQWLLKSGLTDILVCLHNWNSQIYESVSDFSLRLKMFELFLYIW